MGKFFLLATLLALSIAASAAPVTQNKDIPFSKPTAKRMNEAKDSNISEDLWVKGTIPSSAKRASDGQDSGNSEDLWFDAAPGKAASNHASRDGDSGVSEEFWLDAAVPKRSVERTDDAQGSGISEDLWVHGE
ncbi:hypothetical protein ASPCADRAFT_208747 [Aspergillus carbonarius ITEM 5010]|uniref:Uncharacterized protein n=1 Tax=Aspergillus carbonarius (strain ITEM 5010) TaxID=602072 RepID=A0A1R3RI99_ASPC5|nr:hypothetical protein ASPCADRAFT_208747 [Aspergillus carbonarius ITEM 5010]